VTQVDLVTDAIAAGISAAFCAMLFLGNVAFRLLPSPAAEVDVAWFALMLFVQVSGELVVDVAVFVLLTGCLGLYMDAIYEMFPHVAGVCDGEHHVAMHGSRRQRHSLRLLALSGLRRAVDGGSRVVSALTRPARTLARESHKSTRVGRDTSAYCCWRGRQRKTTPTFTCTYGVCVNDRGGSRGFGVSALRDEEGAEADVA